MSSIIPNFAFKLLDLGLLAGKRQVSLPVSETTIAEKNLSDSVYSVYSVVQKNHSGRRKRRRPLARQGLLSRPATPLRNVGGRLPLPLV